MIIILLQVLNESDVGSVVDVQLVTVDNATTALTWKCLGGLDVKSSAASRENVNEYIYMQTQGKLVLSKYSALNATSLFFFAMIMCMHAHTYKHRGVNVP